MSVNKFRFGVRKTVGSPSVEGAMGIETLASHAANPSAHCDYVRKGTIPRVFDVSEHLTNPLDHCNGFLRRDEVMTSHLEFVKAKLKSYTGDASNYQKLSGLQRHVVTAFVLNQVLDDLGLLGGSDDFFLKGNVVTTSGTVPTVDLDAYVPSYALFMNNMKSFYLAWDAFRKEFSALERDFLDVKDAASEAYIAAAKTGYVITVDSKFVDGKKYYVYSTGERKMTLANVTPGDDVPADTYYVSLRDVVAELLAKDGYVLTNDETYIGDMQYYKFNYETLSMEVYAAEYDTPIAELGLYVKQRDVNDRMADEIVGKNGFVYTEDKIFYDSKTYYVWNARFRRMDEATVDKSMYVTPETYFEKIVFSMVSGATKNIIMSPTNSVAFPMHIVNVAADKTYKVGYGVASGMTEFVGLTIPADVIELIGAKHVGIIIDQTGTLLLAGSVSFTGNANEPSVVEAYLDNEWVTMGSFPPTHVTKDGFNSGFNVTPVSMQINVEAGTYIRIRGGTLDSNVYTWQYGVARVVATKLENGPDGQV